MYIHVHRSIKYSFNSHCKNSYAHFDETCFTVVYMHGNRLFADTATLTEINY